jgi:predicted negative regulator of RcsB-dependent stress response
MLISLSLTTTNSRSIVASIEDLHGTALHLSADLQGAKEAYQNSLAIVPLPAGFEASLKLASIFVEIGTNEEVFVLRCATSQ